MNQQRNQNKYLGITFVCVGLILAIAGYSVSDDAVTGTIIYVGAAASVLAGVSMLFRSSRR